MRKVRRPISRRDRRKFDACLLQRRRFKSQRILRYVRWIELVPCLIEQRCGQVFRRLKTLIKLFRRHHFIEERRRDRFPGLVMPGKVLQHLRPACPHLVNLRGILDKVARHTGSAKTRILHVREHPVQGMTELMESGPHLVMSQQRRLALRRFRNVQMIRHHGLGPE